MKKVYFAFLSCLITSYGIAQNTEFLKRVENKYIVSTIKKDSTGKEKIEGRDNVRSKGVVEKLLFGNTNGNVEFYVCPSFEGAYGFRTVRDSSDTFLLEIKRIANWKEAAEEAEKKYPTVGIPLTLISSLPQNIVNLTTDHNNAMWPLQEEERLKLYKVKSSSIPISNRLAEEVTRKVCFIHRRFQSERIGTGLVDGRRRDDGVPLYRRSGNMDAIDPFQNRRRSTRTVRSVQTNHRRRGSGPIRRIEVYRIVRELMRLSKTRTSGAVA